MKLLIQTILKAGSLLLMLIIAATGCQQQRTNDTKTAAFDMQKAKSFIDSSRTKFTEQLRDGDSVAVASHYWPDAEFLLSNSEPIKGKDILSAWGGLIKMGIRDITFSTTDITGDENFLIETGTYELRDGNKTLFDKGNYVVGWKQQNGQWKKYRDAAITSLPAAK